LETVGGMGYGVMGMIL